MTSGIDLPDSLPVPNGILIERAESKRSAPRGTFRRTSRTCGPTSLIVANDGEGGAQEGTAHVRVADLLPHVTQPAVVPGTGVGGPLVAVGALNAHDTQDLEEARPDAREEVPGDARGRSCGGVGCR